MTIAAVDISMRATFGGLLIKLGYVYNRIAIYDGLTIPSNSILYWDGGVATAGAGNVSFDVFAFDVNAFDPDAFNLLSTATHSMDDAGQSWTVDEFVGLKIRNVSDGSESIITSNNATQLFFDPLTGGTANVFVQGDIYEILTPIDAGDEIRYAGTSDIGGDVTVDTTGLPTIIGASGVHGVGYFVVDVSQSQNSPFYEVFVTV